MSLLHTNQGTWLPALECRALDTTEEDAAFQKKKNNITMLLMETGTPKFIKRIWMMQLDSSPKHQSKSAAEWLQMEENPLFYVVQSEIRP